MSFARDKARMLRILRACNAPPAVVAEFEGIARYWMPGDASSAEDVLLDACRRHNFIAPWEEEGREVVFRPYGLGQDSDARLPDQSTSPDGEQSYRRGFDQGMAHVLDELKRGTPMAEIRAFAGKVHEWRTQAIQYKSAPPGAVRPRGLPSKWDGI